MKKLQVNQMEEINGAWSWENCKIGAIVGSSLGFVYGGPLTGALIGCISMGRD